MYWPIGAPRIFAAKVPPPIPLTDYDSEDSGELVRHSISVSSSSPEDIEQDEDESQKVGEQQVEDAESVGSERKEERCSQANGEETRAHIVALKVARSGTLFATVTASELSIWQTKPTAVVAHVRRSPDSIDNYGPNVDILIRPDAQIMVVQTSLGFLMTYSLATDPNGRVYKSQLISNSHHHPRYQATSGIGKPAIGPSGLPLGAGEAGDVREYSLQFRMVIKVDAGIQKALALEDGLMVATIKPAAIQCIRWSPDSTGNQTSAEVLSRLPWIQKKVVTTDIVYDRPMSLYTWVTSDGRAYAVQKQHVSESEGQRGFKGYCFHTPSSTREEAVKCAINARFSMIAVACANGSIVVYNARDYNGNIPVSHCLNRHSSLAGRVRFVTWSPDGYCLFVGYDHGWATWSVYGKPGASTFFANRGALETIPNEAYLLGVKEGAWIGNGAEMLLLQSGGDDRIWCLEFARSAVTGCFSCVNTSRPLLHANEQLFLYRGYDQDDITMISQDASVLWQTVQLPPIYLAENWPIRCAVGSADGRYISVAGTRGLAHYSLGSGRWKTFADERMEQEFVVRGGMCWFQHILIVAVEAGDSYELRLFSRELALESTSVLYTETFPSPIVLITLTGTDSLLVYTYDNVLYHYLIQTAEASVRLVQAGHITFNGIVRSPARVRSISWIVPDNHLREGNPTEDVYVATVIFLVDGKLVLLQPSTTEGGELKYDMRVIMQNVEYYVMMRDRPDHGGSLMGLDHGEVQEAYAAMLLNSEKSLSNSLWVFDGSDVKVWTDIRDVLDSVTQGADPPAPVRIPVDFYPMSNLLDKGIILGIESELVQRRDIGFSLFKFQTRTHLFLNHIVRHHLTYSRPETAIDTARDYESLTYFPHALEVLLHDVLDDEADTPPDPETAVLPKVIRFLSHFPQYLDVIVQCTRKTEVASWRHLFSVVGSPQALFEESLARGNLKTAGGYLLVLHTLEQLESSSQDMVRLFARAVKEEDWDLCKELARFLAAVDESGKTLREALELVNLKSPVVEGGRSFMFGAGGGDGFLA